MLFAPTSMGKMSRVAFTGGSRLFTVVCELTLVHRRVEGVQGGWATGRDPKQLPLPQTPLPHYPTPPPP